MRPIPREKRGIRSIHNIPNPEPLVPGLRRKQFTEAIGFTSSYSECEPLAIDWSVLEENKE